MEKWDFRNDTENRRCGTHYMHVLKGDRKLERKVDYDHLQTASFTH